MRVKDLRDGGSSDGVGEALVAHTADLLVGGLAAGAQEVDNELQLGVAVAGDVTLYLFGALRERQQDVGPDTLARSWTAQLRLCRRSRQLERRKHITGVAAGDGARPGGAGPSPRGRTVAGGTGSYPPPQGALSVRLT